MRIPPLPVHVQVKKAILALSIGLVVLLILNHTVRLHLVLEMEPPAEADFLSVYYDTGNGFNLNEVIIERIRQCGEHAVADFPLPGVNISRLMVRAGRRNDKISLKTVSLTTWTQKATWTSDDFITSGSLCNPVGKDASHGRPPRGGEIVLQPKGEAPCFGIPPVVIEKLSIMGKKVSLCRKTCALGVLLLVLWAFFSERLNRAFFHGQAKNGDSHQDEQDTAQKGIMPYLLIALFLISIMAFMSPFNAHPDEYCHVASARYYATYWLPPEIGHPDTLDSYSEYGVTYLNTIEIVYFLAGKFSNLLCMPDICQYVGFRLFNVFLFLLLTAMAVRSKKNPEIFYALVLTPQVWYVFSYFNNDAFPLFISFYLVHEIIAPNSLFRKRVLEHSWRRSFPGILPVALAFGLLLISKRNYYMSAFYVLFLFGWTLAENRDRDRLLLLPRFLFVVIVALSILSFRLYVDYKIHGPDKAAKVRNYAEEKASPFHKPSLYSSPASSPSLHLREKGVPCWDLFLRKKWHRLSFNSFFGVYGWMHIYGSPWYYGLVLTLVMSFLAYMAWRFAAAFGTRTRLFSALSLLSMFCMALISFLYAWAIDFQPQGRYLFPALPIMAALFFKVRDALNPRVMSVFIGLFFLVSTYSFVLVALENTYR